MLIVALPTTHRCVGEEGCCVTETKSGPEYIAGYTPPRVNAPLALTCSGLSQTRSLRNLQIASANPEPTSPDTMPPTVYPFGGGGGGGGGSEPESPLPPPHPTMSRARNVTDPIERHMMIPL